MSWLSSLVPISLPNNQGLMEQWLACLIHSKDSWFKPRQLQKSKTNKKRDLVKYLKIQANNITMYKTTKNINQIMFVYYLNIVPLF